MAKTFEAPFAQNKRTGQAVVTQANTAFASANSNTALVQLYAATADGALVKRVSAIPLQTISATQLQLFRQKGTGPIIFWKSVLMPAYTLATNDRTPAQEFAIDTDVPWSLEAGEKIYAGIGVAAATGIAFTLEADEF